MSMSKIIEDMKKDDFSMCMNPPEEYKPTDNDVEMIMKIKNITSNGNSAEVKKSKDGFTVYEVRKNKR